MKLEHPNGGAVETTEDLAAPYLRQGWTTKKPTKSAARASAKSGDAASTPEKEKHDGE